MEKNRGRRYTLHKQATPKNGIDSLLTVVSIWIHNIVMFLIEKSSCFDKWLRKLKDRIAVARILVRIKKVENGNLGEYRSVGGRVSELKIDYGPGYRLYFTKKGDTVIWLLCGGDKSSQSKDIKRAKEILKELEL